MKGITIDGESISKSITAIIDAIRYRKYAKEGYVTVIYINKENNQVQIRDGKIDDEGMLHLKGSEKSTLVNKVYILPTKKIVTKCCLVKEDVNATIDINVKDTSKITPILLDKYTKTKLMSELKSFDLGQVILGASVGIVLGACLMFAMIMATQG